MGVFDGLDSLTHLDLSHTDLLKLGPEPSSRAWTTWRCWTSATPAYRRRTVPVGVFDPLSGSLEVLRLSNESPIGGYRTTFSNLDDDFFQGPGRPAGAGPGGQQPAPGLAPVPPAPGRSLRRTTAKSYTRPADLPANFLQYASGRIDHELGILQDVLCGHLEVGRPHRGERHHRLPDTAQPRFRESQPLRQADRNDQRERQDLHRRP